MEGEVADFDEVFDVAEDLVGSCDLLWKLALVDHGLAAEEGEDEQVALSRRGVTSRAEVVCILMGCSA